MQTLKRTTVAIALLLSLSGAAFATCPNTGSDLHAGYINGMLTSWKRANENLRSVMAGLDPVISGQGHNVEWALHYNQDEGAREQAKELLYQKLEDEGFFKAMKIFITLINSKVDSVSLENLPFASVKTKAQLEAAIKNWIKRQYAELESLILAAADTPYAGDADVGNAVAAIHAEIVNECRKILLIPHSQGNFYANAIWDGLYAKPVDKYRMDQFRILGIIGLGSPAGRVGNDLASTAQISASTSITSAVLSR